MEDLNPNPATYSNDADCRPCAFTCSNPFSRVVVSYLVMGGTRVMWELKDEFLDARPYTFTLQVGQSANPEADDWTDVGVPVVDIFYSVDGEQRVFGKMRWQFYRVKLESSLGVYYSEPTGLLGTLSHADWSLARYTMWAEQVAMEYGDGQLGYLLKRRVTGRKCRRCTDPLTDEITNPNCSLCWGTGFECGYFFPIGCVWADISPKTYYVKTAPGRGTVNDIVCKARIVNPWMLSTEDIFIQKATDDRYYVHSVQNIVEFRGVPITAEVELRLAPPTDVAYALTIPNQVATLEQMAIEA